MRLTSRISACGEKALSCFPSIRKTIDECVDENGHLSESLAREAIDGDCVTWDSKDNCTTCAVALEFVKQIRGCISHLEDKFSDKFHEDAATKIEKKALEKMDKGKVVFVRTTIKEKGDAVRLIFDIGNPYEIKGTAMIHAWNLAVMCARIAIWLKEGFAKGCGKVLLLEEGKGTEGLMEEARRMNREEDEDLICRHENEKREKCSNKHGEYCSPSNPECKCYCNGKCVALESALMKRENAAKLKKTESAAAFSGT